MVAGSGAGGAIGTEGAADGRYWLGGGADADGGARGWRKDTPVPGMFAVSAAPAGPVVTRNGPTPTDVVMPCFDNVTRTPGMGVKLFLNRQPIVLPL